MPIDPKHKWLNGRLITYLLQKSKDDPSRQKFIRNATRFRRWFRGESFLAPVSDFDDMEVNERNATARRNIIGEVVDEVSSLFMKNSPVIRRTPYLPHHAHLSDGLDALWLWAWGESYGQAVFRSILEDSEISGLGIGKIFWDPRKANRHYPGMVAMRQLPAVSIYVDPDATNDHMGQDAKFIIQHVRRYPEELMARYGDDAAIALGWRSARGRKRSSWSGIISMLGMTNDEVTKQLSGRPMAGNRSAWPQAGSSEKIDLYEAWIFPQQMFGAELSIGDKITEEYRFGLVATMIRDQVIRVKSNPFAKTTRIIQTDEYGTASNRSAFVGHGTHPFLFLPWRPISDDNGNRRFYDVMGMVEWMVSMQFNVNALRRNMAIISRTLANPTILFNEDALATPPEKIMHLPGQVYRVRGQYRLEDSLKILQPAQMPSQVPMMIAEDMQGIRQAGGVKAGVTGLFPAPGGGTSHTPSETIGTLQEAAFTPLWKYVQQVGASLRHLSVLYDGLVQQFFSPGQYMGVDRRGEEIYIDWTGDHRAAQFRRIVVAGATTPLFDLERQQREAGVLEMTIQAVTSGDPRVMRAVIISLENMKFPWAYQYMQLIIEELQRTMQMSQGMQQLGEEAMKQQAQLALPAGTGMQPGTVESGVPQTSAPGQAGVEDLAAELGVSSEQLIMAVNQ